MDKRNLAVDKIMKEYGEVLKDIMKIDNTIANSHIKKQQLKKKFDLIRHELREISMVVYDDPSYINNK